MSATQFSIDFDYFDRECDFSDLQEATHQLCTASESQFSQIQSEKWYTRLFDTITFSQKKDKRLAANITNLAQAQHVLIELLIRLSARDIKIATLVEESYDKIAELSAQDIKIAEAIKILRDRCILGLGKSSDIGSLSSTNKEILAGILLLVTEHFGNLNVAQQKYNDAVLRYIDIIDPQQIDLSKTLNEVTDNTIRKKMLICTMELAFLHEMNFDFEDNFSVFIDEFDFGGKTIKEIKEGIQRSYKLRGIEGFYNKYGHMDYEIDDTFLIHIEQENEVTGEEKSSFTSDDTEINTIGNDYWHIYSKGQMAFQGKWAFFANVHDEYKLYAMDVDTEKTHKLTDDPGAFSINVIGDNLYYIVKESNYIVYKLELSAGLKNVVINFEEQGISISPEIIMGEAREPKLFVIRGKIFLDFRGGLYEINDVGEIIHKVCEAKDKDIKTDEFQYYKGNHDTYCKVIGYDEQNIFWRSSVQFYSYHIDTQKEIQFATATYMQNYWNSSINNIVFNNGNLLYRVEYCNEAPKSLFLMSITWKVYCFYEKNDLNNNRKKIGKVSNTDKNWFTSNSLDIIHRNYYYHREYRGGIAVCNITNITNLCKESNWEILISQNNLVRGAKKGANLKDGESFSSGFEIFLPGFTENNPKIMGMYAYREKLYYYFACEIESTEDNSKRVYLGFDSILI